MRLIHVAALPGAFATMATIRQKVAERTGGGRTPLRALLNTDQDPVRDDLKFEFFQFHNNYGCWGYFSEDVLPTKYRGGMPVDGLDELFQHYVQAITCAGSDNPDAGDPFNVDYESPFDELSFGNDPLDPEPDLLIVAQCALLNNAKSDTIKALAIAACEVETRFISDYLLYKASNGPNVANPSYMHNMGFDPNTDCISVGGSTVVTGTTTGVTTGVAATVGATQCCGTFPNRLPMQNIENIRVCSSDGTTICDLLTDPNCP